MNKELITTISPAVAKAAIESGVSQKKIKNWDLYNYKLKNIVKNNY
jgi:malate dehydrogenase (oxaloacetate-decarboxylating)(NADP+)